MINFQDIERRIQDIVGAADRLASAFNSSPGLQDMRSVHQAISSSAKDFKEELTKKVESEAIKSAKLVSVYGAQFGSKAQEFNNVELRNVGLLLVQDCEDLQAVIEGLPMPDRSSSKIEEAKDEGLSLFHDYDIAALKAQIAEHEKHDERIKKLLSENEVRVVGLEQKLKELEKIARDEVDKITAVYSRGEQQVITVKQRIDDLLELASKDVVAGNYSESAAEEKVMANGLRWASLACMTAIAIALGYSFWETTTPDFSWERSLFRVSFAFLLSVPAAYLARESAKHREQQYQHLQTSLDLKAIAPFVASLPEEEQHKIKILIASKVFAGRDFSKVGADPYPVNVHELVMEIIKKLDLSNKPSKPSTDQP